MRRTLTFEFAKYFDLCSFYVLIRFLSLFNVNQLVGNYSSVIRFIKLDKEARSSQIVLMKTISAERKYEVRRRRWTANVDLFDVCKAFALGDSAYRYDFVLTTFLVKAIPFTIKRDSAMSFRARLWEREFKNICHWTSFQQLYLQW
jgi:hypothetical protein